MTRGLNEFLNGLKFKDGETSQNTVAEEAIKRELFIVMNELDLENGQVVKMNKVVQLICDKLGIHGNKYKIAQIATQVFQDGKYLHKINADGNIEAAYGKAELLQKQRDNRIHKEAEDLLHVFIEKVEQYASQLEKKKVRVTEITLMNQFSEEELQKNRNWIDLAIGHVLEIKNQEK